MDIGVPYNLQRYLYYLCGENSEELKKWMTNFNNSQGLVLNGNLAACMRREMASTRCSDEEIRETISGYYSRNGYILDPHTAVGVHGALQLSRSTFGWKNCDICVVLATAGPHKFADLVEPVIGRNLDPHLGIESLKDLKNCAIKIQLNNGNCAQILKDKFRNVLEKLSK